jgi:hypothetical protein
MGNFFHTVLCFFGFHSLKTAEPNWEDGVTHVEVTFKHGLGYVTRTTVRQSQVCKVCSKESDVWYNRHCRTTYPGGIVKVECDEPRYRHFKHYL